MPDYTSSLRAYEQNGQVRIAATNLVTIFRTLDAHNRAELPETLAKPVERLAEALQSPQPNLLSDSAELERAARDAVVQAALWYVDACEATAQESILLGKFVLPSEHSYDHLRRVVEEFKAQGGRTGAKSGKLVTGHTSRPLPGPIAGRLSGVASVCCFWVAPSHT